MNYRGVQRVVCLALVISGCSKTVDAGGAKDANAVSPSTEDLSKTPVLGSANMSDQPVAPSQAGSKNDAINMRAMTALRKNMVGHATLDNEVVVDIVPKGSCVSEMITKKGRFDFDWATVGNLASETVDGVDVTVIKTSDGPRKISVPSGDTADRVAMGMGLLAENCEGGQDNN